MGTLRYILGLESSCDDTAAAVLDMHSNPVQVLSSVVENQNNLHKKFGGVVPEIAARAHAERLDDVTNQALSQANVSLSDIDGIAVTAGPGLIGGVMSGVMFAKGIALATNTPFVGVNHLAGHALTPRLTDNLPFPYLLLLVSGGHCQFLIVEDESTFHRIGGTIDDAPGEAFDKVARVLGLAQPGGPSVEQAAKQGDPKAIRLPRPLIDKPSCDLSFSGLKTAVIRARDTAMIKDALPQQAQYDIAAGFQQAVVDVLVAKSQIALNTYFELDPKIPSFAVAGGVAANQAICGALTRLSTKQGVTFSSPPLALCTDNAAMIAFAGAAVFNSTGPSSFDLAARPRWPLDSRKTPMLGSGRKGPKA